MAKMIFVTSSGGIPLATTSLSSFINSTPTFLNSLGILFYPLYKGYHCKLCCFFASVFPPFISRLMSDTGYYIKNKQAPRLLVTKLPALSSNTDVNSINTPC